MSKCVSEGEGGGCEDRRSHLLSRSEGGTFDHVCMFGCVHNGVQSTLLMTDLLATNFPEMFLAAIVPLDD